MCLDLSGLICLHCGCSFQIGTFEVPLRSLKDGVATDHWVPVHRAASILHLKVKGSRGRLAASILVAILMNTA